jgi:hypothetical protein
MIIGPDPEAQLAPYHEFECTGLNDEYVQDVDITEDILSLLAKVGEDGKTKTLQEALEWHGLENKIVSDLSEVETNGDHKYGWALVQNNQLMKAVERTNPDKKWDWFEIGGRWAFFLKLKPGAKGRVGEPGLMTQPATAGRADSALFGDIDIEGMRNEDGEEASERWIRARKVAPDPWESWVSVRNRYDSIDAAREFYNNQPAIKALAKGEFWMDVDKFLTDHGTYVENARNAAMSTFAILYQGKWYERGEMGWFGCASNEKEKSVWLKTVEEVLSNLGPTDLVTIVDCHI